MIGSLNTIDESAPINWRDAFYQSNPEIENFFVFFNFERVRLIAKGTMVITILFLCVRLAIYAHVDVKERYSFFIGLNIVGLAIAAVYFGLMQKIKPDAADDITAIHAVLVHSGVFFVVSLLSVAAGFEYVEEGTFTRLFFALLVLCSVFVFNWYVVLSYLGTSLLTLFLTVYWTEGALLKLGIDHMHLPVLFLVCWVISRTCYMAAARDYLTQKTLEQANCDLKTENLGRLKALQDLKRSEGYLETLFEKAPDAYMLYDTHRSVFTRINAYGEKLFGLSNEAVAGKKLRELAILTENDQRLLDDIVDETMDRGFAGPYEIGLTLDGSSMVVELHCSLTSLNGRTMLLVTARDVTSRKHAEEKLLKSNIDLAEQVKLEIFHHKHTENALRKTEEQARILIEKMNDGFVMLDMAMNVTYANERLCHMLGCTAADIFGRRFLDFIREDGIEAFQNHLDASRNQPGSAAEIVLKKISGGHLHAYISPQTLYDEDGRVEGRFSVITDITRIKAMEKALRESEEMKQALLDATGDSVAMLSPDGTILMANKMLARNFSVNPDRLKGKNMLTLLKSGLTADHRDELMDLAEKTTPSTVENTYGGRYFVVHIYPILDKSPSVERIAIFARDVTDLKKAEKHIYSLSQELIKVQENERQRIARDLHDDVAQELASLKIMSKTLFDDPSEIPEHVKMKITKFTHILQHTIMSVRSMAYNLRPPDLDQLGLVATIDNYIDDFSQRNRITVDFFSAGVTRYHLTSDAEINLYRIIQEALHNIVKYAHADHVTIRLITSFPNIILRIVDNGTGFDLTKRMVEANMEKRMGLRSMEERTRILSGELTIRSMEEMGTKIVVEIPISKNTLNTRECA